MAAFMRAFMRAFIFCDGCREPMDNSTVPSARNISEARRDAKRLGWSHKRNGGDLCEGCTRDTAAGVRQDGAQQ